MDSEIENNLTQEVLLQKVVQDHQYQVKHGIFKWSIENFSSFPAVDDKYIQSPIFKLSETSWCITLHPRVTMFSTDKIALNLIRHKSDPGPPKVIASYRFGLESYENKIWFKPTENVIFGKKDCYGFQTSVLGHLEDFSLEAVEDDKNILSVLCEIYTVYISSINMPEPLNLRKLPIDSDLPSDLINSFLKKNGCDILIQIPKLRVRAHKSVLSARSKPLARILEDGKSVIQLFCTQSCLYCVLYYMYSGSFTYLAKNAIFSIGLYELACELSLSNLQKMVTPHHTELKSRIIIDKCEMSCALQDFYKNNTVVEKAESQDYFDEVSGIGFKIIFQKVDGSYWIDVNVKLFGIATALYFSYELYILSKDCEPSKLIPAQFLQNSQSVLENSVLTFPVRFRTADILNCCSLDGNLYLKFECKRYLLTDLPSSSLDVNSAISLPDDSDFLKELSTDLNVLLRTSHLSDVTLIASGNPFKAHRSILSFRSTYFQKLFLYDQYKKGVFNVPNVTSRTLQLMLTYMYTGTIDEPLDFSKTDALKLYEVAEEYEINSLRTKCMNYFSLKLDPWFVFEVLSAADVFGNSYLTGICMKYLEKRGVSEANEESEEET